MSKLLRNLHDRVSDVISEYETDSEENNFHVITSYSRKYDFRAVINKLLAELVGVRRILCYEMSTGLYVYIIETMYEAETPFVMTFLKGGMTKTYGVGRLDAITSFLDEEAVKTYKFIME